MWLAIGWAAGAALACTICAPADGQSTLLFQMHAADAAVIARPEAGGARWQRLERIKGEAPADPIGPLSAPSAEPALLLYTAAARSWRVAGALSPARAGWARQLATLRPVGLAPPADWGERLALFAADLEDREPLVARTAYEEIAVAPYGAMRQLRARWPVASLRRWVQDPALAARQPLYLLLLGMAGAPSDAALIERLLPPAEDAAGVPRRSAALAALVELRGAAAVDALERQQLADPARSSHEVQAAVMALGVHAADGRHLSRERAVQAYAALLQRHPAQAGWAASDLAAWGEWRFGTRFAQILQSDVPLAFASRYAMVFFLMRSPRAEDQAALQALRAAGRI